VTFTSTVSGASGAATGSVTFNDGATVLGTVTLNGAGQAALATSALAAGSHSITAAYNGDAVYAGSSSAALPFTITAPNPPRLFGISTRMQTLTGNNVLIGGFIIGGSVPKTVVVRAKGPSLTALGVTGALQNPTMTIVPGSGPVLTNDDWQTDANAAALSASGFAPTDPHESAILTTLAPGGYTAIVSGVGNTTGVALVEVYEIDHPEIPLVGISTRGQVLTGNNVMIGGFIIQGTGPQQVVVRAKGPSLTAQGVTGALANPTLTIVPGTGPTMTNDDWQTDPNAAALLASGFAPTDPHESAILVTLQPGAYTAIVSGVGGTTGVGLVEVYIVP
jgi:hypothetical protein